MIYLFSLIISNPDSVPTCGSVVIHLSVSEADSPGSGRKDIPEANSLSMGPSSPHYPSTPISMICVRQVRSSDTERHPRPDRHLCRGLLFLSVFRHLPTHQVVLSETLKRKFRTSFTTDFLQHRGKSGKGEVRVNLGRLHIRHSRSFTQWF